jgi:hypothetical protein
MPDLELGPVSQTSIRSSVSEEATAPLAESCQTNGVTGEDTNVSALTLFGKTPLPPATSSQNDSNPDLVSPPASADSLIVHQIVEVPDDPRDDSAIASSPSLEPLHQTSTSPLLIEQLEEQIDEPNDREETNSSMKSRRVKFIHSLAVGFPPLHISTWLAAAALTIVTAWIASSSFHRSLLSTSPILPNNPQNAIIVVQVLVTISIMAVRECFLASCEVVRESLETSEEGLTEESNMALKKSTDWWELIRMIFKSDRVFRTWRIIATLRFFILYVFLLLAQFIWLLEITPRPTYHLANRLSGRSSNQ